MKNKDLDNNLDLVDICVLVGLSKDRHYFQMSMK